MVDVEDESAPDANENAKEKSSQNDQSGTGVGGRLVGYTPSYLPFWNKGGLFLPFFRRASFSRM